MSLHIWCVLASLERALQTHFGWDGFRPGQRPVVDAVLAGRDALAVLPTGGGKSLCYQLPALVREGLVVVISPLVALMEDQVMACSDGESLRLACMPDSSQLDDSRPWSSCRTPRCDSSTSRRNDFRVSRPG